MSVFRGTLALCATTVFATASLANTTTSAQTMLTSLGYDIGKIDGSYGRMTASGLERFYSDRNQTFDGKLDQNELDDLRSALGITSKSRPAIDWTTVDGNTRDQYIDCRDRQRGLVDVVDQPDIEADWLLNNDFGAFVWQQTPQLKSCLYRDGTGWAFNAGNAFSRDYSNTAKHWFAPAAVVGGKGFNSIGNMHNDKREFPVQVSNIDALDYQVKYSYSLDGVGNTHIALWFSEVKEAAFEGDPDTGPHSLWKRVPELEVMLKIGNNSREDEGWKDRCRTNGVWTRYSVETAYGVMPACLIGAKDNKPGVAGLGVEGQFASSSVWFTDGWRNNQIGYKERQLDLHAIVRQLIENGFVKDEWYLMGIEFQTEIVHGKGEMEIHSLTYDLKKRQIERASN